MAETVYKAKKPFKQDGKYYYPITTHDQIIMPDGNRWDGQHLSSDVRDDAVEVGSIKVNADLLGGKLPEYYKNATTLGGVAAEDYALKTDTAPNSAKLGGKAPEYYLQPRNLLDNSDFTNPVNQRGQTSYSTGGYTIDRWNMPAARGVLSVTDNGLIFDNTSASSNTYLNQELIPQQSWVGKTFTLAYCTSSGVVGCTTFVLNTISVESDTKISNNVVTDDNSIAYVYMMTTGVLRVQLLVYAGKTASLRWAALYEGSYTADTLPPYVPKGYAAELAECQRYFWLCDNSYFSEGCGYAFTPTECRFMISTPQTMRISPSIIAGNNNTTSYGIKLVINGTVLTPTSVSVRRANNRLCLTLGGNFTTNAVGVMRIESQLSFSADL